MTTRRYLTIIEMTALILADHPTGMTTEEVHRHPFWAQVRGTWTGAFQRRPSILDVEQALISRHDGESLARSDTPYWKPTTQAVQIADAVRPVLDTPGA